MELYHEKILECNRGERGFFNRRNAKTVFSHVEDYSIFSKFSYLMIIKIAERVMLGALKANGLQEVAQERYRLGRNIISEVPEKLQRIPSGIHHGYPKLSEMMGDAP